MMKVLIPWIQEIEASGEVYSLCENVLTYWIDGIETKDVESVEKRITKLFGDNIRSKKNDIGTIIKSRRT